MALFKILKGDSTALKKLKLTEGYCYVTTDEGKFYVDITGTKRICLNAEEADKFGSAREIKLTGNVTGSASSDGESGWSIATTISNGAVTNAMLAGSIANNKLTNSAITIAGNSVSLGNSISAATLRESLGLSNAMHFVGIATVAITDGSTTNPSISGYTTKQKGDVIIDKDSAYEYVWTGTKWERLGGDGSYKTVQTAVDDPTASGNSSTFIKTISQNENGVITATKATIANHVIQVNGTAAGTYNGGTAVTLNLKNGNGITVTDSKGTITFAHSNSVTAKTTYGSTTTTASANGGSITVTDVKYDAQGHITGSTDRTITLSQTTYTMAGLMGSTAKGSATLPVYWNGKAWTTITSYSGKASTAGTADKVAKSLSINGKSFDGSAAVDVGALGISYGGTGATTASAALTNLGAAAADHTHGMITNDGKLSGQTNKVMVAGEDGAITAYGGTAVRSMIGAAAESHSHSDYLPLAGGTMTGYISWGNAANAGLEWITDNGTRIHLRPYSPGNIFQITLLPDGGTEFGAVNIDTSGNISFAQALTIANGGTGASDLAGAQKNLIKTQSITEDTDILTLNNGMYHFEGATTIEKNWPYAGTSQRCEVFVGGNRNGDNGYPYIIVIEQYNGLMYMNNFYWDSWRGWHQIFTSGNAIVTTNKIETWNATQSSGWTKMWTDNEGGNIEIGSKSGYNYQMDAYDDNLRLFSQKSGSVVRLAGCNGSTGAWSIPNLTVSGEDSFYFSGITQATSNADRPIWFGGQNRIGAPTYNANLTYNPSTHKLKLDGYESQTLWMRNATSNTSEVSITFYQGSTQRWTLGAGCGAAGNDFTLWDHTNTTLALDMRANKYLYVYGNWVYDQRSVVYSSTAPTDVYTGKIWLKPV